jgi:uncharacterized membrane protein
MLPQFQLLLRLINKHANFMDLVSVLALASALVAVLIALVLIFKVLAEMTREEDSALIWIHHDVHRSHVPHLVKGRHKDRVA